MSEGDIPDLPSELLELWLHWEAYKDSLIEVCPPWATPKEKPSPKRSTEGLSVIAEFNKAHDVESLLESYGYRRKGKRWLAPSSSTGLPGIAVLKDGRVFSHHGSDPLGDGYAHDAFDVYRILEQGGDFKVAVREAAKLLGVECRNSRNSGNSNQGDYDLDLGPKGNAEWPEPQTLPAGLPQVEPFELGLLPNVFRPWIEDIAERMQCPPDFPAVSAMVALAAVVGKRIGIRPKRRDDWLVIPNLWGGIIGRPGVMKTPALAEPMKPLYRLEIAAKKAYLATLLGFEASQLVSEERKKVASGKIRDALKKGGDAIGIARDAMENDQDEPIRRRYVVNDPTVEKLGELLNQNPNGLLLFRDELSGFLRTLDKEGCENARAFYLVLRPT